jgi:lysozyme family protein
MASYTDIATTTLKYQRINLETRGVQRPAVGTQEISFDKALSQALDKITLQNANYKTGTSGIFSQAEIEDELKFRECLKFVLGQEGSRHVADDGGKESSRYGILQSTARSLGYKGDVKNISKGEVEAIYRKLWNKSGAKDLSFPMSLVHFDTYVNSPGTAKKLLKNSDGNLEVYLKSREQRYTRLAEARPETFSKYLKGWKNRIRTLKNVVAEYTKPDALAAAKPYGAGESGNLT